MENRPPRSRAGAPAPLLLILLSAAYCMAYIDRLMMAVVAEPVKQAFALSDTQLFLLTGAAFVVIYGIVGALSGALLDRWSRRKLVILSLGAWSLCTVACGFAGNFWQLALARAGVGVGEAAIVPAAISLISDTYPPERRPLAMAIFYAGGMAGILLAWMIGGWIASAYGWRPAFFLAGPPGLIVGLLILWRGEDPPREAAPVAATSGGSTFRVVWCNRPLVWLIGAGSVVTFVNIGLVNQLGSFFIRSHGMSVREVGLIFGPLMAGGMACGLIGGGWIGNRLAAHGDTDVLIRFSLWNTLALFPLYMLIFLVPSKTLALAATFVGTSISVLYSPCYSAAYQAISAPHTRATAAGISSCANALIGSALATFLVGMLSDHWKPLYGADSLRYAMMAGMVTCLLSALMFLRARALLARESGIRLR
ncbi:spinster family MFS transporter [Flavisphingomonas formosensis]|uniref:spinster family MFS transporter n=1 Tax=Flavisphingomonas formosensis TaxID=861534 RepID=UPI0012F7743A|nr:MFS transporter [Sphingomonas formosensis]